MNDLVDVYIVGAQKAGTTSLFKWLSQHPQIFGPEEIKDFPLFSGDEKLFSKRLERAKALYGKHPGGTDHLYLAADANLSQSEHGIERLAAYCPHCTIIFLLRRPDERCFSAWKYAVERGLEKRSFFETIEAEISGDQLSPLSYKGRQMNYLEHTRYASQLRRLEANFPRQNIHLIPFEILTRQGQATMRHIASLLGIDPDFSWNLEPQNQTTKGHRSRVLSHMLYREKNGVMFEVLRKLIPWSTRAKVRRLLISWNRKNKARLQQFEKPSNTENEIISEHLQEDFVLYEQVLESFVMNEPLFPLERQV